IGAGAAGLAGCSTSGEESSEPTPAQGTGTSTEDETDTPGGTPVENAELVEDGGFDLITDSTEMTDAVDENGYGVRAQIRYLDRLNQDVSDQVRAGFNSGLQDYSWAFDGLTMDDLSMQVRGLNGAHVVEFDDENMSQPDIVAGYEGEGLEPADLEADHEGYEIRRGEVDTIMGRADLTAAVKDNYAVIIPNPLERGYGSSNIEDTELALEEVLETVEDTQDSMIEGDEFYKQTVRAIQNYFENEDLGQLEGAQTIMGAPTALTSEAENVPAGVFNIRKIEGNTSYSQEFNVLYQDTGDYTIKAQGDIEERTLT
ncbi:MAG: hypothetical protein BRC26_02000, partial [Nanohaloarchaea archaeon QH_8_44_6]